MEADTTSLPPVLHPDLLKLVDQHPGSLVSAHEVTRLKSVDSLRATYRLEFSNGSTVKGRVLDESAQVAKFGCLAEFLDRAVFPSVLVSHGHALLEEWKAGTPLNYPEAAAIWSFRAGQVLGSVHTTALKSEILPKRVGSLKSRREQLKSALESLLSSAVLSAAAVQQLERIACSNAPELLDAGLVHLDFCAENMIEKDGSLYVVDNELLDTGIIDADLARTWYRWPNLLQVDFLRGYNEFRDATAFLHHQTFWAVYTLAVAADYRLRMAHPFNALIESMLALVSGNSLAPWRRFHTEEQPGRRIKVAFSCDNLATGGQEQMCLNMVKSIDRTLFEPLVYAFRGGRVVEKISALGVPVNLGSLGDPLSWRREWTALDEREEKFYQQQLPEWFKRDEVEAVIVFASPQGLEAALKAGIAAIIEKLDGPRLLDRIPDKSNFNYIVAESSTIAWEVTRRAPKFGLDKSQVRKVYPGIDLEQFSPESYDPEEQRRRLGLNADDLVIGYVGRLAQEKNLGLLVHAFAGLSRISAGPPVKLLIAGPDHGVRPYLENLITSMGIGDRVKVQDEPDDVAGVMSACSVFAMSSDTEGLPTAILEAMSMGLPIVSTDVGSIREVVRDNGILVAQGDNQAMTAAFQALIADADLRERYSKVSLARASRFGLRHNIVEYERMLLDILKKRKAKSTQSDVISWIKP